MAVIVREGLIRRLVDAARRERCCVVLGGPGMGRTNVAREAVRRLRLDERAFDVVEVAEDAEACARALADASERPRILAGGLELHRALAETDPAPAPGGRLVQRFPLVPLLRRDVEDWAERAGERLSREEVLAAFEATGGHPSLLHAWFEARRSGLHPEAVEKAILLDSDAVFARMHRALEHPELAAPLAWLLEHGSASVARLRRETGARKPALDRLVIAGPVSRTLGERAEITLSCRLYARWRAAAQNASSHANATNREGDPHAESDLEG